MGAEVKPDRVLTSSCAARREKLAGFWPINSMASPSASARRLRQPVCCDAGSTLDAACSYRHPAVKSLMPRISVFSLQW
jgi:hypothetical protein